MSVVSVLQDKVGSVVHKAIACGKRHTSFGILCSVVNCQLTPSDFLLQEDVHGAV